MKLLNFKIIIVVIATSMISSAVFAEETKVFIDPISKDSEARTAREWHSIYMSHFRIEQNKWLEIVRDETKFKNFASKEGDKWQYLKRCLLLIIQYGSAGELRAPYFHDWKPESEWGAERNKCHRDYRTWWEDEGYVLMESYLKKKPIPSKAKSLIEVATLFYHHELLRGRWLPNDGGVKGRKTKAIKPDAYTSIDRLVVEFYKQINNENKDGKLIKKGYFGEKLSPEELNKIRLYIISKKVVNSHGVNPGHHYTFGDWWIAMPGGRGWMPDGVKAPELHLVPFENAIASPDYVDEYPRDPLFLYKPEVLLTAFSRFLDWRPSSENPDELLARQPNADSNRTFSLSGHIAKNKKPVFLLILDTTDGEACGGTPAIQHLQEVYGNHFDFILIPTRLGEIQTEVNFFGPQMDYSTFGSVGFEAGLEPFCMEDFARNIKNLYMHRPALSISAYIDNPSLSAGYQYRIPGVGGFFYGALIDRRGTLAWMHRGHELVERHLPRRAPGPLFSIQSISMYEDKIRAIIKNGGKWVSGLEDRPLQDAFKGLPPIVEKEVIGPQAWGLRDDWRVHKKIKAVVTVTKVNTQKNTISAQDKDGKEYVFNIDHYTRIISLWRLKDVISVNIGDIFNVHEEKLTTGKKVIYLNKQFGKLWDLSSEELPTVASVLIHADVTQIDAEKNTVQVKFRQPKIDQMKGYQLWKKEQANPNSIARHSKESERAMQGIKAWKSVADAGKSTNLHIDPTKCALTINGISGQLRDIAPGDIVSFRTASKLYSAKTIEIIELFVSTPIP